MEIVTKDIPDKQVNYLVFFFAFEVILEIFNKKPFDFQV